MYEWNPGAEEAHHHADQVDHADAAGGGEHAELEVLGRLDEAGAVGHEQRSEGAEGEEDRLAHDPRIATLEADRDTAEREAFQCRIAGRRVGCPLLPHHRRDRHDEATDHADHGEHRDPRIGRTQVPGIGGRHEEDRGRERGLVDRAADRHDVVRDGGAWQTEGLAAEGRVAGSHAEMCAHDVMILVPGQSAT